MLVSICLMIFTLLGFYYRFFGLSRNYSFWSDESQVAILVRAILQTGRPVLASGFSYHGNQQLQYYLSALAARIMGFDEFSIRFPSVIFGVLTILVIYLLGKSLFTRKVAFIASFLAAFLKIEILYSRQARPYQALQFFYVLSAWFLYRMTSEKEIRSRYLFGFILSGLLASLMHGLGLIIFLFGGIYFFSSKLSFFKQLLKNLPIFSILALISSIPVYMMRASLLASLQSFGRVNNWFYYRIFLTQNYLFISFLATLGLLILFLKKRKQWLILALPLLIQLFIVALILPQPFTRYFYLVFPFLILSAAFALTEVAGLFPKHLKNTAWLLFFLASIYLSKDKLAFSPQATYSLNEDMQEIPEVDWQQIYNFVGQKQSENPEAILAANWMDLPIWYLGEGSLDHLLRKNELSSIDPVSQAIVIDNVVDFASLCATHPVGLVVIDSWDNLLPDGLRLFADQNLKKELEIDRLYETQPRYWPVTVYSWGL